MGYKTPYLYWINDQIGKVYNSIDGLKMLELGNQVIRPDKKIYETTGKEYFTRLGYHHISVDLNGLDGALTKDLSKLEDFIEYKEYFDVITNAGTIEHVEPYESQYTAFLNVHNSLKIGGIAIHIGPDIEFTKKGHCQYYYDLSFWENITKLSDYEFIDTAVLPKTSKSISKWRLYAIKKIGDKFISANELLSKIHVLPGPVGGMYIDGADKKNKNRVKK
jgi:hypothetical protein|tara:strand:+ start:26070 stop:26729 length:660 start_codon:yes stop_codon:yes gene_type:complete